MRNSFVFCKSVSADRSGMAASSFLAAAAACAIQLCFAAESPKSHCHGCMKVANGALATVFSFWVLMIFLLKFLLNSDSKPSFFRLGVEIWFWR